MIGGDPDVVTGTAHQRADGKVDRVTALLGFEDQAVASFYHSVNRTESTERTTIRLAFEHGHVTIDGWIPTRLEMDGEAAPDTIGPLRELFADALRTTETASTRPRTIGVKAVTTMPDRQNQYRLATRAGMSDLIGAIDGIRPLRVTSADGLRSLEIAVQASG